MDRDIGTMLREIVRVTFRAGPSQRARRRRWVERARDAAPVRAPRRVTRFASS